MKVGVQVFSVKKFQTLRVLRPVQRMHPCLRCFRVLLYNRCYTLAAVSLLFRRAAQFRRAGCKLYYVLSPLYRWTLLFTVAGNRAYLEILGLEIFFSSFQSLFIFTEFGIWLDREISFLTSLNCFSKIFKSFQDVSRCINVMHFFDFFEEGLQHSLFYLNG